MEQSASDTGANTDAESEVNNSNDKEKSADKNSLTRQFFERKNAHSL